MDKTNFTKMLIRHKRAELNVEKLSEKLQSFVDEASTKAFSKITVDMAQIMVVAMAKRYHMDEESLLNNEEPLTEIFYTIIAYGYSMALLDASEKETANDN